jgi:hypothetical protein
MNYLLEVCLIALTLATGITSSVAAQSPVTIVEEVSGEGVLRSMRDFSPAILVRYRDSMAFIDLPTLPP